MNQSVKEKPKPKPESEAARLKRLGFYFDERASKHALSFFENFLVHSTGQWAGRPFKLQPWQRDSIIRPLFGWKRKNGLRRFNTAYVEVPRKNGKSELAAGVALYLTTADGEPGGEVYGGAVDALQARIVFERAVAMRQRSRELRRRTKKYRSSIVYPTTESVYRVISGDTKNKDGLNAHGVILDEFHAQKNRELYDVLDTSTGSRRQPILFIITTAGFDRNSICWELHDYAIKVLRRQIVDDAFLPVIFPDPGPEDREDGEVDWTDPKEWRKANPNMGISVTEEYLAAKCEKAKQLPGFENAFRRLHLNQWTEQDKRWMKMAVWDATAGSVVASELEGMPCYGGLDLASTTDIAAFVLCFQIKEDFKWLPFFWVPEENMRERVRKDRVPYDLWVKQGLMKATPGNVIDYKIIIKDILALREFFDVREVAYDRWGATKIQQDLCDEGVKMIPFGQGFGSMSAPSKELLALALQRRIHHGSHAILRWMASNVVMKMDSAENMKPDKAKSTSRIDGIVAGIMALDRAIRHDGGTHDSVYDERGLRAI